MATRQNQKANTSLRSVTLDSDNEYDSPNQPKDTRSAATASSYNEDDEEYNALIGGQTDRSSDNIRKDIQWNAKHIIKIIIGAGIGSLLEFYSFGLVAYFEPGIVIIVHE